MKEITELIKNRLKKITIRQERNILLISNMLMLMIAFFAFINQCSDNKEDDIDIDAVVKFGEPYFYNNCDNSFFRDTVLIDKLIELQKIAYLKSAKNTLLKISNDSNLILSINRIEENIITQLTDLKIKIPFEIEISNNGGKSFSVRGIDLNIKYHKTTLIDTTISNLNILLSQGVVKTVEVNKIIKTQLDDRMFSSYFYMASLIRVEDYFYNCNLPYDDRLLLKSEAIMNFDNYKAKMFFDYSDMLVASLLRNPLDPPKFDIIIKVNDNMGNKHKVKSNSFINTELIEKKYNTLLKFVEE